MINSKEDNAWLALFMALFCPAFLIFMANGALQQISSLSWPSVPGEIQGVVAKEWEEEGSTKYYGRAVYRYAVDGTEYTSDLTELGPGRKREDPDTARADVADYQPGMNVPVYYDPDDPTVAVLETGIPTTHVWLLIGMSVGTVFFWIESYPIVRGWFRQRRESRSQPKIEPAILDRPTVVHVLQNNRSLASGARGFGVRAMLMGSAVVILQAFGIPMIDNDNSAAWHYGLGSVFLAGGAISFAVSFRETWSAMALKVVKFILISLILIMLIGFLVIVILALIDPHLLG